MHNFTAWDHFLVLTSKSTSRGIKKSSRQEQGSDMKRKDEIKQSATGQSRSKGLAGETRQGLWVVEVLGCSVISSHACPCSLETCFPFVRRSGVECKWWPLPPARTPSGSESSGPPLNELSLKCYCDSERCRSFDWLQP